MGRKGKLVTKRPVMSKGRMLNDIAKYVEGLDEGVIKDRLGVDIEVVHMVKKELGSIFTNARKNQLQQGAWNYFKWYYTMESDQTKALVRFLRLFGFIDNMKTPDQSPIGLIGLAVKHETAILSPDGRHYDEPLTLGIKRLCHVGYVGGVLVSSIHKSLNSVVTGSTQGQLWDNMWVMDSNGLIQCYETSGTIGEYNQWGLKQRYETSDDVRSVRCVISKVLSKNPEIKSVWVVDDSCFSDAYDMTFFNVNCVTSPTRPESGFDAIVIPLGSVENHESYIGESVPVVTGIYATSYFVEAPLYPSFQTVSLVGSRHVALTYNLFCADHVRFDND